MIRQRVLKIVLVIVGLFFTAAIYPVLGTLTHPGSPTDTGDDMMMGIYFVMGIFLLLALRHPAEHRSFISFTAWANIAHAVVMTILGFQIPSERRGFIGGSAVLATISVVLIVLLPPKVSQGRTSSAEGDNLATAP